MTEKKPKHIMVVNDMEEILELFRQILHDEAGYEVTITSFEPIMLDIIKKAKPDLIISDHVFGEEKYGWQFVQRLKMDRETMYIPIIVCSGAVRELRDIEGYLQSKNVGVLYKPFDVDELLDMVVKKLKEAGEADLHTGDEFRASASMDDEGPIEASKPLDKR